MTPINWRTVGRVPAGPAHTLIREYIMNLKLRMDAPFPSQVRERALKFLRLVRVK